jgi:glycosyltransferase involved in cell wall biosynthesis
LQNREESRRFGRNARQRVLEHFTIEKVTGRMERVYEQILNGGLRKEQTAKVTYG